MTSRYDTIYRNIVHREQEVFDYGFNIENFERMLAKLPPEWTQDIQAIADCPPDEQAALVVAQHRLRDEVRKRLINERVQLQTSRIALEVLLEMIPPDELASRRNQPA